MLNLSIVFILLLAIFYVIKGVIEKFATSPGTIIQLLSNRSNPTNSNYGYNHPINRYHYSRIHDSYSYDYPIYQYNGDYYPDNGVYSRRYPRYRYYRAKYAQYDY